ncbi:MAG: hypothetical protein Q9227_004567 [Pyrenula ochraceoflavens]
MAHQSPASREKNLPSDVTFQEQNENEKNRLKLLHLTPSEALESLSGMPPEYYKFSDSLEWRLSKPIYRPSRIEHDPMIPNRAAPATTGLTSLPPELLQMIYRNLDWRDWLRFLKTSSKIYSTVTEEDIRRVTDKIAKVWPVDEDFYLMDQVRGVIERGPYCVCRTCLHERQLTEFIFAKEYLHRGEETAKRLCVRCYLWAKRCSDNEAPSILETSSRGLRRSKLHSFCGQIERTVHLDGHVRYIEHDTQRPCQNCPDCLDIQVEANKARADWIIEHKLVEQAIKQANENCGFARPPPAKRNGTEEFQNMFQFSKRWVVMQQSLWQK